jgi:histone-lysine N-methyltransferase SETMAR
MHSITVSCFAVMYMKRFGRRDLGNIKKILLHGSTYPHTANLTKVTLVAMGWEIMNHPPYRPDLVSSDFHLSGPMKIHLGG